MLVIPSLDLDADFSRAYAAGVAGTIHEWERAGFTASSSSSSPPDRALPDERLLDETSFVTPTARPRSRESSSRAKKSMRRLRPGAAFVVLGTRALDELDWLTSAASRFPGQLMLTTPARERRARARGARAHAAAGPARPRRRGGVAPLAGVVVEFAADAAIGHAELALLEDVADDVEFPVQVAGGLPDLGALRDLEFRGISAAIIERRATVATDFDGQTLARSFSD